MKEFLKKTSAMVAIVFVIVLFIGLYKEKDGIYTAKRYLFEEHKSTTGCIVLGVSHTFWGIVPRLLPYNAINIAELNKPVEADVETLEHNVNDLKKLKFVIIPVDYFTFYYSGEKDAATPKYYHHWNIKDGFLKTYTYKKYHLFTCGLSLFESIINHNKDSLAGFEPQYGDFSRLSTAAKQNLCKIKIASWNAHWVDTTLGAQIAGRVKDLAELLVKKNIIPVFITMPVTGTFSAWLDKSVNAKTAMLLNNIITQTGAKYVNLADYDVFKDESLFFDCDHLNPKGAEIATKLLAEQLEGFERERVVK